MTSSSPDLFAPLGAIDSSLERAESRLLRLADFVYTKTSLKPMSKVLFFVSRTLLALREHPHAGSRTSLVAAYQAGRARIGEGAPQDDYDFGAVLDDLGAHLKHAVHELAEVAELTKQSDALGLAFDTLLRGKFESGEGLGTFLTPEEVVRSIVAMMMASAPTATLPAMRNGLLGDICGGTGRFVRAMVAAVHEKGEERTTVGGRARLFDQSAMSVGLGRLNFAFEHIAVTCEVVSDSLTDETVSRERGGFSYLATNPPFGTGKYRATEALFASLPLRALSCIGVRGIGDLADPAALFLLRNLDLLAENGVLGIVLPDGVMQSPEIVQAIKALETEVRKRFELLAVVSLPTRTFAMGGTVAKTSFMIWRREAGAVEGPKEERHVFLARAEHVGFEKRGNRRVADKEGNDLERFARAYADGSDATGTRWGSDWRSHDRLTLGTLSAASRALEATESLRSASRLDELAVAVRESLAVPDASTHAHVSILSVDETGLIDLPAAVADKPITAGLRCKVGDVLVSCLNPRKWRVTVIPKAGGFSWSCSAEFIVLRPKANVDPWLLSLRLQHRDVREAVSHLAVGTSSSRQRVPKRELLCVSIPELTVPPQLLRDLVDGRLRFYELRVKEVGVLAALSRGETSLK